MRRDVGRRAGDDSAARGADRGAGGGIGRGGWLLAGFGVGLGLVAAVAALLWFPRTRKFLRAAAEDWLDRVTVAVREGVRAARSREAELELAIRSEEAGFIKERPDYII